MSAQESGIDLNFDTIELDLNDLDNLLKQAEEVGYCELRWKQPTERQVLLS